MTQATRCKPGDLAYIVHACLPENIGKVCEVLERDLKVRKLDENPGAPRWLIRKVSPSLAVDRTTGQVVPTPAGSITSIYDSWLRPISGVPLDDDVDTTEDLTEELDVPA